MPRRTVQKRRAASKRRKGQKPPQRMFATLATIAFLCYIRQKLKAMWSSSGYRRCIFYFLATFAVLSTIFVGYITYNQDEHRPVGQLAIGHVKESVSVLWKHPNESGTETTALQPYSVSPSPPPTATTAIATVTDSEDFMAAINSTVSPDYIDENSTATSVNTTAVATTTITAVVATTISNLTFSS